MSLPVVNLPNKPNDYTQTGTTPQIINGGTDVNVIGLTVADSIAVGNSRFDFLTTGASGTSLLGLEGNDSLSIRGLNDTEVLFRPGRLITFDGGADNDQVLVQAKVSELDIHISKNGIQIASPTPLLIVNVEQVSFGGDNPFINLFNIQDEVSQRVIAIFEAAFNRGPDIGGYKYWTSQKDDPFRMAERFLGTAEGQPLMAKTNEGFVDQLYRNVLDRPGEKAGFDYWVAQLENGAMTRGSVLGFFSISPELDAKIDIDYATGYMLVPTGGIGSPAPEFL